MIRRAGKVKRGGSVWGTERCIARVTYIRSVAGMGLTLLFSCFFRFGGQLAPGTLLALDGEDGPALASEVDFRLRYIDR